jgi:ATP synthase protein I
MAFNPPNPNSEQRRKEPGRDSGQDTGGLASLVQAEKLMQIAFVLPCAALIGWGLGWWIDHHFGTHWATIGGLVFGLISGMVSVIRMALSAGNTPPSRGGR